MSFYVEIKKIREQNNSGLYHASNENNNFYFEINTQRKKIKISQEKDMSNTVTIDLNNSEQVINIPWIHPKVLYAIITKSKQTIKDGRFENDISFCS